MFRIEFAQELHCVQHGWRQGSVMRFNDGFYSVAGSFFGDGGVLFRVFRHLIPEGFYRIIRPAADPDVSGSDCGGCFQMQFHFRIEAVDIGGDRRHCQIQFSGDSPQDIRFFNQGLRRHGSSVATPEPR